MQELMPARILDFARERFPLRRMLVRAAVYFLALGTVFVLLVLGVMRLQAERAMDSLVFRESTRVDLAGRNLERQFEEVGADLRALIELPGVQALAGADTLANRAAVAGVFASLVEQKQIYDQMRFLNLQGHEVVRVDLRDGHALEIGRALLQDKRGRYYFRDAVGLQRGQISVSPMDLNIENGSIEVPYKPMIRFSSPVFDAAGVKRGVVVLNVYGRWLIDTFRALTDKGNESLLLNRDGDWLVGPDPNRDWGFMFGRPPVFATYHADSWHRMLAHSSGHLITGDGLMVYSTVYPARGLVRLVGRAAPPGQAETAGSGANFWKVVSVVPQAQLPTDTLRGNPIALAILAGGLLALAVLSVLLAYLLTARRRLQLAVDEHDALLREMSAALGEGVMLLDEEGLILYMNREAERLLGWRAEELLGQDAHERVHEHDEDQPGDHHDHCAILRVARSGQVYRSLDEVFVAKDGRHIPTSVSAAPLVRQGRFTGVVVAFEDISPLKHYQEEICRLAYFDALTGLPNRRLLEDRLEQAIVSARRHHRILAVLFLDLDHFKDINDTYGHEIGDALLRAVADRLTDQVRGSDTVVRQGGDEFVVLLPEIGAAPDAAHVAQQIVLTLRRPFVLDGVTLVVSASVGVALYPDNGTDAATLLRRADTALYAAKAAGRNAYALYREGDDQQPEVIQPAEAADETPPDKAEHLAAVR